MPKYLPEIDASKFEFLEIWRGLRPCTPDGLPLIGRHPRFENLTMAAGHAMIGLSTGPGSGELVAQILTGEKPFLDTTLFGPARFG